MTSGDTFHLKTYLDFVTLDFLTFTPWHIYDCNSERGINRRRCEIVYSSMNDIQILRQNPSKVLESLRAGEVERMELSVEQITDEFMIYVLRGGLIDELSNSFPDPRKECEITAKQILSASIAGHFQDMYALSQSPYALHSPILLAELGLNVKVLCEGEVISRRGTQENIPFTGDVIRKMFCGIADPFILIEWYNSIAGVAYLRQARYEPCIHILDCTELEVVLENENYEGSGIVSHKRDQWSGSGGKDSWL